jgi:membrane protease YdiL (CAAX protease family)
VDPADPGGSDLPTGPHPVAGPGTVRMPRWPGPVLIIGGALVALGAYSAAVLVETGQLVVDDRATLLWLLVLGGALFIAGLVYVAVRQIRVRRHLPPERYRGPAILILLVLALVSAGLLTVPFSEDAAALLIGEGELSFAGSIVLLFSTGLALLAVSWLFVFRPRALAGWPSWSGPDPGNAIRAGLAWGAVAWLGATAVAAVVALVLERLGMPVDRQAAEQALALVDPWIAVLAIVVLAPIAEELFFRGVVFNAWLREAGPRVAYIGSAALFAVIHLSFVTVLPIFLLGLALAWVYRRTGNLLAPIAMHAVVNGISVAVALLVRYGVIPVPT